MGSLKNRKEEEENRKICNLIGFGTPEESDICSPGCSETKSGVRMRNQNKAHPPARLKTNFACAAQIILLIVSFKELIYKSKYSVFKKLFV
jgi:hypothetical protein